MDNKKARASMWSVATTSVFIVLKILVFVATGSVAVLAEALHSTADLVGSALALLSIKFADTPPDTDHAYGHGKYENMSGMLIAFMVCFAGCMIIFEAAEHLKHPAKLDDPSVALGVMALSTLANFLVSRNLLRVGKETDSAALIADGHHLQTDIITSASVFFGIGVVAMTHVTWVDPLVASFVGVLIFFLALKLGVMRS
jgi:cation diffusion facilitator family transporter